MKRCSRAAMILIGAVSWLHGCATGYHGTGLTGGFSETQIERNSWIVTFQGNAYTSDERASHFVLLRSAQLTLESGYRYFIIVNKANRDTRETYTQPASSKTSNSASSDGTAAEGSSKNNSETGQTYTVVKPGRENTIVCFAERPNLKGTVYDAAVVWRSLAARYEIQGEPQVRTVVPSESDAQPLGAQRQSATAVDAPRRCTSDTECKGDRICERGHCVDPSQASRDQ